MRQLHRTTCTYPDLYLLSICASLARMVTDSMWLTGDAAWCVYNVVFLRLYGMGLGGVFRAMDIFWDEIPAWWILCFFTNNRPPIRRVDNHLPSLFPEPEEKKRKLTIRTHHPTQTPKPAQPQPQPQSPFYSSPGVISVHSNSGRIASTPPSAQLPDIRYANPHSNSASNYPWICIRDLRSKPTSPFYEVPQANETRQSSSPIPSPAE